MPGLFKADKIKSPWIVAHRGFRAKYQENTLIAFQAALNVGVTMIEFDVTHTRDDKLVVMRDNTLDRTTNGRGSVNGFSLKKLKNSMPTAGLTAFLPASRYLNSRKFWYW